MKKATSGTTTATESHRIGDVAAEAGTETFLEIGTFEVVSGTIIVGDPCYEKGDRRAKLLRNVKRGTWHAVVVQQVLGPFGLRNGGLMCRHASVMPPRGDVLHYRRFAFDVDSGLAGVFDAALYGEDPEYGGRRMTAQVFTGPREQSRREVTVSI